MSTPDTVLHKIVRESPDLADTTRRTFLCDVNAWIAFAGTDPKEWTRWKAQEFYKSLLARMKTQSANRIMATLTYVAGWWAKYEAKPELNFALVQKATPDDVKEREALTYEQGAALVEASSRAESPTDRPRALRDKALCVVLLETGMRRMSAESMRLESTGMGENGFPITRVRLKGKSKKYRYPVPLSEAALAALEPWIAFLRKHSITHGPVWRSLYKRIGGLRIGAGLSAQSLYEVVVKHGKAVKIPDLTPHIFRHTFITWRLDAGWTPQQIAAVTGHQLPLSFARSDRPVDIGSMAGYSDPKFVGPRVSTATPDWLLQAARRKQS